MNAHHAGDYLLARGAAIVLPCRSALCFFRWQLRFNQRLTRLSVMRCTGALKWSGPCARCRSSHANDQERAIALFSFSAAKCQNMIVHQAHNASTFFEGSVHSKQQQTQCINGATLKSSYLAKIFSMLALMVVRHWLRLLPWGHEPPQLNTAGHSTGSALYRWSVHLKRTAVNDTQYSLCMSLVIFTDTAQQTSA